MKNNLDHVREWIIEGGKPGDDGMVLMMPRRGTPFMVVVSWGSGWDHVSISTRRRCPSWDEMCWFKNLFFEPEETVMQLHPPASAHINNHPFCLHLWRPQNEVIPAPKQWMVGIPGLEA
jgi:hypothetical protein